MTQPKLITKPFADDALPGYVNEIPKENPVGAPEQNASWSVGFPPITMTDIDDGGLPPNGEDMNGVLRAITEHNLFIGGGGVYEFTDEYVTEVGGYHKGAVLISDDKTALWMSIQDNNTQNFNGATKTQWRRIAFTELDSTLASIQNALNTKADKSVTITAGDGLTGGGTLAGNRVLAVNSSVVRTDRTIAAGTGLSGGGNLSANLTLSVNYGATAGTSAQGNDARITGAAQKAANLSDLASASAARQNLGLGTAATRDVGESSGRVMEVGAFGLGVTPPNTSNHLSDTVRFMRNVGTAQLNVPPGFGYGTIISVPYAPDYNQSLSLSAQGRLYYSFKQGAEASVEHIELHTTGNILTTTGQSTEYPMTQKAVTDALNTKVGLTGNQTIAGVKTFSSFPVTPSAAPTANYQAANKKYVDDNAFGVGQSWIDVTSQRSLDTNYTNNTGKAIMVVQVSEYYGPLDPLEVFIDNVKIMSVDQGDGTGWFGPVSFVVPNGSSYRIEKKVTPNIASWMELR